MRPAAIVIVPDQELLPRRPMELRVGVGVYIAAAALNLLLIVVSLVLFPAAAARLRAEGRPVDDGLLIAAAVVPAVLGLAFSAVVVFLALRLRRGNALARPAVITVSILSLAGVVTGAPALAVVVLFVLAGVLVTRRAVTAWLRAAQGLPPA